MKIEDLPRDQLVALMLYYAADKVNYKGHGGIIEKSEFRELFNSERVIHLRTQPNEVFHSLRKKIIDSTEECRRILGLESN